MKKLAILLSVVLVMALAVPAFAADITWTGSMKSWIEYLRKYDTTENGLEDTGTVTGKVELTLNSKVTVPGASVNLAGSVKFARTFPGGDVGQNVAGMTLKNTTVELKGALREGGQNLTISIGNYTNVEGKGVRGYSVTGMKLGQVDVALNWNSSDPNASNNPSTIVRLSKGGQPLTAKLTVKSVGDSIEHYGDATLKPNDKVDFKVDYKKNGKEYTLSSNVKATNNVSLYGEIKHNDDYKLQAAVGLAEMPFNPSVTAGYRKSGANTGYFATTDLAIDAIKARVSYDKIDAKTRLVAGSGAMYDLAIMDNNSRPVQPFAELFYASNQTTQQNDGKRQGYVLIMNQVGIADPDLQLAARLNLKDIVNLGVSANTTIEVRGNMKMDSIEAENPDVCMVGVVASTKLSAAGFNNISLSGAYTYNMVGKFDAYKIDASYTAPNQLVFAAGYSKYVKTSEYPQGGYNGNFTITATRTINF
jgi:hypothetical protein